MEKIFILWLRQTKRYFRSRSRIVASLAQPLLYLLALGFGFGTIFRQAGQGSYLQFLTPGIISMSIIFTAIYAGMEVLWDRQFGFLKETLVAPMPRFTIMLGRTLGGATVATLQGLIVLLVAFALGFRVDDPLGLLAILPFMFLMAFMFTSLGTAIASLINEMQAFQLIMNFLVLPMFFLSGALYPLDGLPLGLSVAAQVNPLAYGVDAIRGLLTGTTHFGLTTDAVALLTLTAIFLCAGSRFFSRAEA